MSAAPLSIRIRRITVVASSVLDARRLGDSLPRALQRALADRRPVHSRRPAARNAADRAARDIAEAVWRRVESET